MKFVLLDDVADHHSILSTRLMALCARHGWEGEVALATTRAEEVAAYAAACTEPTVYFLDIELRAGQTSLELFRDIQAARHDSYIIYVSAHPQYAMTCLHTHAFDFLLKPWTQEQLESCMKAVMRMYRQPERGPLLRVDTGSRFLMVPQSDILYFSRERMNTRMHCADGSVMVWRESFEHLLPRLAPGDFLQCHRGYVVSLRAIREVDWMAEELTLLNGQTLPVSRRRAPALKRALSEREVQHG